MKICLADNRQGVMIAIKASSIKKGKEKLRKYFKKTDGYIDVDSADEFYYEMIQLI